MGADGGPRSVDDATRFTTNAPHATAKHPAAAPPSAGAGGSGAQKASSTASRPADKSGARPPWDMAAKKQQQQPLVTPGLKKGGERRPETLDEKVRRLRAAHLAAQRHKVSRFDRIYDASRPVLDFAHRATVTFLIGFSGLIFIATIYASVDMMLYNKKRRAEFFAQQAKFEARGIEAARIAYMLGTADDEQIALVEEANASAKKTGVPVAGIFGPRMVVLPDGPGDKAAAAPTPTPATPTAERTFGPGDSLSETNLSAATAADGPADSGQPPKKSRSLKDWVFGGPKHEDPAAASSTLSANSSTASGGASLRDRAKSAFDAERENQKRGGPLDRIGLDTGGEKAGEKKKSGWWPWQ